MLHQVLIAWAFKLKKVSEMQLKTNDVLYNIDFRGERLNMTSKSSSDKNEFRTTYTGWATNFY